jgi:flagellar motility protein MotE (MotC chaperone)
MAKINQDILNEVQTIKEIEALEKQNMERLKDLDTVFQKFDNNLNKVGKLIEKVPDDSVVRPNRNWLNMFGL